MTIDDYEDRMRTEAYYREAIVTPEGAEEWLSELLKSCGREFGDRPEKLALLLGVLCSNVSNHASHEVKALFFRRPLPSSAEGRRWCAFNPAPLGQNVCEPLMVKLVGGDEAPDPSNTCRHCGRPRTPRELGI